MHQTIRYALLSLLCGLIFLGLTMKLSAKTEEPAHRVLSNDGDFEIREYNAVVAAEVVESGDRSTAANHAFRILFNYISGENRAGRKITMTTPVAMSEGESQKIPMTAPVTEQQTAAGWHVRFFLPPGYTLETVPLPTNPAIQLVQIPVQKVVCIRFSGSSSQSNLSGHKAKLETYIHQKGLEVTGEPVYAFYNAPFVPPPFRRNEIFYLLAH